MTARFLATMTTQAGLLQNRPDIAVIIDFDGSRRRQIKVRFRRQSLLAHRGERQKDPGGPRNPVCDENLHALDAGISVAQSRIHIRAVHSGVTTCGPTGSDLKKGRVVGVADIDMAYGNVGTLDLGMT